jgi:drug/metabolite transporter (DMT)-like permease
MDLPPENIATASNTNKSNTVILQDIDLFEEMSVVNNRYLAYIKLTLAMAIVGSSVVVSKLVVASFPVFLASALRFGLASIILLPLSFWREKRLPLITRRDWMLIFLQTFCGVFLFSVFLLYGLKLTSAAESGIITSSTPAILGLISFVFLKDRLTLKKGLGIVMTLCGVLAINLIGMVPGEGRGVNPWLGNLLVFGAVIGEALFSTFRKLISPRISSLAITTLMSVIGFILFLPFALPEAIAFNFLRTTPVDWSLVLYCGIVVTVIAYLLWFSGLAEVSASTAAVFTGVWPVSAVVLSYLVLKEPYSPSHLLGIICVLGGISLIALDSRPAANTHSDTSHFSFPSLSSFKPVWRYQTNRKTEEMGTGMNVNAGAKIKKG